MLGHTQKNVTVKASVDKTKILIGERFQLSLEAVFPSNKSLRFFSIDSISHFIIINKEKADTQKNANGISINQKFLLTSFDSGQWVIPSFQLDKKIKTEPIPVDVIFSNFDASKDYHDIKDIITLPPEKDRNWWILPAILTSIVLVAIAWLLRKKKSAVDNTPAQKVDAFKEAMQQLQQVQKSKVSVKQYYSSLTDIFRLYIFRKKRIMSLQETTEDLVLQIKNMKPGEELFTQLSQALQLSDSVKFAKFIPSEQDNKLVFDIIKAAIEKIENTTTA